MYRIATAALALAAAFALAPTPAARALADPVREVFTPKTAIQIQQTSLQVSRADFASQETRIALLGRIEDAAAAVCQAKPPSGPEPTVSWEQAVCRRAVIARTAWRLHDPELWSLTDARVRTLWPELW
jgi:UrcA family protein